MSYLIKICVHFLHFQTMNGHKYLKRLTELENMWFFDFKKVKGTSLFTDEKNLIPKEHFKRKYLTKAFLLCAQLKLNIRPHFVEKYSHSSFSKPGSVWG